MLVADWIGPVDSWVDRNIEREYHFGDKLHQSGICGYGINHWSCWLHNLDLWKFDCVYIDHIWVPSLLADIDKYLHNKFHSY